MFAGEPGVRRHVRFRYDITLITQVHTVPLVAVTASDPRQVRSGALRSELERMVIHGLSGEGVMTIALSFGTQRPHHLRMTVVATFANENVAALELKRCLGLH